MAVGELYVECQDGFKRYDQNASQIVFGGSKTWSVRSWGRFISDKTAYFEIYTKNVSKVRFVTLTEATCGIQKIELNDEVIETPYYSKFPTETGYTNGYNKCCCELDLTKKYNKIKVYTTDTSQFNFSYVDVNEDGELITKDEYEYCIKPSFLIKDNEGYKSYNRENLALELVDYTTLDKSELTDVKIDLLPEALSLLTSFDNVKVIVNENTKYVINAIKNSSELVVMRNDFYTSQVKQISSILANTEISDDSKIKMVMSEDSGLTWKTYSETYGWTTVPITIPQTQYNKISDEEKELWLNALEYINNNGIGSDILGSIDFSTLNVEKIRFAFVITNVDHNSNAKLTSIICNAKMNSYMTECKDDEVDKIIVGNTVKVISHVDTQEMVVNISTVGVTSGGFDYDAAEHKPVLGTTVLKGTITHDEANIAKKDDLDRLFSIVSSLTGDRDNYRGYYATESERDAVITDPKQDDYCVVDASLNEDTKYKGKTLKYFYNNGSWEVYLIIPTGQVQIDDASISNNNTWSSEQIKNILDTKQESKSIYSIIVDSSQLVLEENGEYEGFYKVTITHGLGCGESFYLNIYNQNNQPFNMGVILSNITPMLKGWLF